MTARDALTLATRGGAEVLGRKDIGHLAVGMCADLALFNLRTLGFAGGAVHDPVGSLLLCLLPGVGAEQAGPLLALALGLLAWSFAVDVRWRYENGSR